jgi:hypothetical protein
VAATVSDETAKIKKAIDSPNVLHFKGISIVPYGFFNGESVTAPTPPVAKKQLRGVRSRTNTPIRIR